MVRLTPPSRPEALPSPCGAGPRRLALPPAAAPPAPPLRVVGCWLPPAWSPDRSPVGASAAGRAASVSVRARESSSATAVAPM
eukprot:10132986-Lingulodinium_polyedra.AAC.1